MRVEYFHCRQSERPHPLIGAVFNGEVIVHVPLVDPDNPDRVVDYGETGRVRLTTLTREFFMPGFLERDEAEREQPCDLYPWDGVRNVRPFSGFKSSVVEGVY